MVNLSAGNNVTVARPGQDITLKCIVQSNPGYLAIVWTKGVSLDNKQISH